MPDDTSPRLPHYRRRKYLIDRTLQVGIAVPVVSAMAGIALMSAVAVLVFLGREGDTLMMVSEIRSNLLLVIGVYFVLAVMVVTIVTLVETHRFAGPIYVISQAIEGMRTGNYDHRLTLRKRDFLKGLAAQLDGLREIWAARERSWEEARLFLADALARGDVEGARRMLGVEAWHPDMLPDSPAPDVMQAIEERDEVAVSAGA